MGKSLCRNTHSEVWSSLGELDARGKEFFYVCNLTSGPRLPFGVGMCSKSEWHCGRLRTQSLTSVLRELRTTFTYLPLHEALLYLMLRTNDALALPCRAVTALLYPNVLNDAPNVVNTNVVPNSILALLWLH